MAMQEVCFNNNKTSSNRDGMIQGIGVLMHHAKSIMIPEYITALKY